MDHAGAVRARTTSPKLSHPSLKLSNSSTVTSTTAISSSADGGGEGGSNGDANKSAGVGGGGKGEVSAQAGAPNVASTKAAARACLRVTRACSTAVSKSEVSRARRAANASRSSTAVRCFGPCDACSHSLTAVTPSADTQSGSTSTRHDDVLSMARARSMCSTGKKPRCSREDVSLTIVHSACASEVRVGGG